MADFAYRPDFQSPIRPRFNVLVEESENGTQVRRLVSAKKLRSMDLEFKNRSTTEMNAVLSFYDAKYGPLTSFTIDINGSDILGCFVKDSFEYSRIAPGVWSYKFTFQEVVS